MKKIIFALAAVIAVLVVVIAMQPSSYSVSRSTTINAGPQAVFGHVSDFTNWQKWSPFLAIDPNAATTISDNGKVFTWSGNWQAGRGKIIMEEIVPNERVTTRLTFLKPLAGTAVAEYTFQPITEDETLITWTMSGENGFAGKAIGFFANCEKMMGDKFDEGLANLKRLAEDNPEQNE